jgi:hypothetical protein
MVLGQTQRTIKRAQFSNPIMKRILLTGSHPGCAGRSCMVCRSAQQNTKKFKALPGYGSLQSGIPTISAKYSLLIG